MGNILKYQNPSSPLLINTGYTTHSNKELNDIETFNSNWFKYRDSQLANSARRNPYRFGELNSLQKAFPLWVSDAKLANLSRDWINNRLGSVVETHTSEALKDERYRKILKEIYHEYFPYGAVDSKTLTPREITDSDLKYIDQLRGGTYIIPHHTIIYADGNQNTTAKVHERLHAAQPVLPYSVDRTPIGRQDNVHYDDYYDSQKEIYARLMELRYANKLDPSHTYTIKEVKAMRNDPNFKDFDIFDRYTDDYILMLLNEVAQNTTDPNRIDYKDPVTFAKKGGRIHIKKKNRGKFTEYCGGKVTEECIARGKKSKDPKIRKRSTFAANARKWKHENGGILKAQEGTPKYGLSGGVPTYMQPKPFSPIDIAIKTAQARTSPTTLPPGVKEVAGPDGQKIAVRSEQPLVPLEQSIAEWLPGTGDVAEVGYIANDIKNGRYGSTALGIAMVVLPGNVGKVLRKGDTPPVSKLSEAERLGIPKGQRSNPAALEDPQYWGYKQWNERYNAAVRAGNWEEVQRLRDLHFITKAPDTKIVDEFGMPKHMYHGRPVVTWYKGENPMFTRFEGINWDVEDAVEAGSLMNHWKLAKPVGNRMSSYHTPNYETAKKYAIGSTKKHLDGVMDNYLYIKNPANYNDVKRITGLDEISDWADFARGRKELMELGYDGLYIPQFYDAYGAFVSPSQFKSADPITWDGKGEIIPIVKRDNFRNLDTRYQKGGKL